MTIIDTVQVSAESAPIQAVALTPTNFKKYGAVFSANEQVADAPQTAANQGTAVKLLKVAPVTNNSSLAPSGKLATANWNIFRCSPPRARITTGKDGESTYLAVVLERHPYSTQTFVPMGRDAKQLGFLVICAPPAADADRPDFEKAEAFLCRGDQSITYGVGVWHAPMVALGEQDHLDFAVLTHENGIPEEDCEEVSYEPGFKVKFTE